MRSKSLVLACVGAALAAGAFLALEPAERLLGITLPWPLTSLEAQAARGKSARPDDRPGDRLGGTSGGRGGEEPAGEKRQRPATAVVTAAAKVKALPITLHAVGFAEAIATVDIKPQITGTVVSVDARDGQMVKAGDLLLKLDDRTLRANIARDQAAIDKDQATLQQHLADAERARTLVAREAGSRQLADQAQAQAKATAAQVDADKAMLQAEEIQLGYTTITAPIAGRIGVVNTSVGNYVAAGTALMTITQMAPLRVSFSVPEHNLDMLRAVLARPIEDNVAISVRGDTEPRTFGTLDFVDSSVDRDTGTLIAKADVENLRGELWPGQYVGISVRVADQPQMPTVPLQALQQGTDGSFVFRVKPDRTVERVKIEVADIVGSVAAVKSGLSGGDHVVIEGQLRLGDGAAVRETLRNDEPAATTPAAEEVLSSADTTGVVR